MKNFIRVKSKDTGHQFDVHRSAFDPERYELLDRFEPVSTPRRPKPNVKKTTAAKAGTAEKSAPPVESVGTQEKEKANG